MCWPVLLAAVAFAAAPDPPQDAEEQAKRPLKIAVLGLEAFHLEPAALGLLSDRLAQGVQLGGVQVATPADVADALGAERQEELAACAEASQACREELAGALGADALLTGSAGRFGRVWQIQVEVISADGALLASFSRAAQREERLLDEAQSAAQASATKLLARTGREPTSAGILSRAGRANVLSLSPVALGVAATTPLRYLGAEYERVFLPWLGLAVAPQYVSHPYVAESVELTVAPRFYPAGDAPGGLFAGPLLTVGIGRQFKGGFLEPSALVGAMVGYTFLLGDRVPLSVGMGEAYSLGGYNQVAPTAFIVRLRVFPLLRANLGISF